MSRPTPARAAPRPRRSGGKRPAAKQSVPQAVGGAAEQKGAVDREAPTSASGKRRGRPPGSVSLTKEIQDTIAAYIRGGAMAYVAAEAAGISARTFREWMERGEGRHPTRPATAKLRRFVRVIDRARAEARVAAEARIYREDPKFWLTHVARSRADREGWTEPVREDEAEGTFQDARQILARKLGLTAAFIAEEEAEAKGPAPVWPEERPSLRVVRDLAARTNPGKREGRAS